MRLNLITGGAGFIGSHLAEELLQRGESVFVVDDLSTGSIRNIDPLRGRRGFDYTIASIMDKPLMAELVDRCDRVFHMAAAVGVRLIVEKPVDSIETNIRGTELVLELAARKNRPILIASSSEVYGKGVRVPFSEEDDILLGPTTRPRWSYACSKAIDEFLALAYFRERQLPAVVVRLFNTVGPRQTGQYGMVIPRFVSQALAGKPISVYGNGSQSRCFCHVADVVNAIVTLMDTPAAAGQVFNVGSDHETTILQLAELIVAQTKSSSAIEFIPFEQAYDTNFEDLTRRVPDLTRIRSLISWAAERSMEDVIAEVIRFQQEAR